MFPKKLNFVVVEEMVKNWLLRILKEKNYHDHFDHDSELDVG